MTHAPDRKPIVWAFSLSRLNALLESVVPEYAGAAEIRVFHQGFEEALATTRELTRAGHEVDVLLSAGANGAYLRQHAPVPVAVITPSGLDLLQALAKARRISRRVGIVTFGGVTPELEQFKELYGLEIEQRSYRTVEDAHASVRDLADQGAEVIVGPSLVTDLSEQAGLRGVFLYSQNSVREAIDRALEIARVSRIEEAKRARVDAVLRHLHEAVASVDPLDRIQSLNPAMERLLGVTAEEVVGQRLSAIAPSLSLASVLETGQAELEEIVRLGRRTVVTHRVPLHEAGVRTGAVLTCQDATTIERVDRSLRSRHRPRRFVARYRLSDVVGTSPAIQRARALALRYARTDATVLITGESGTGKELFAQGIHAASARAVRPFVAINCAALPETLLESELFGYDEGAFTGSRRGGKPGLFEAAHTGTLFLDEIGDLPLAVQTRLLRVLQEREVLRLGSNDPTPVDVRVVAATHRDLERSVEDGTFRQDLYYRLNILELHVPPLAARREDVEALAAHLLARALPQGRTPAHRERVLRLLLPHLKGHAWPGNVRELENVVARVAALFGDPAAETVGAADLRALFQGAGGARPGTGDPAPRELPSVRRRDELRHIQRVLRECGGNRSEAARRLGIGRSTLWRKLTGADERP